MFSRSAPALRTLSRAAVSRAAIRSARVSARNNSTHSTPTGGSSDLPWIIGAIVFTVPSSLYLLTVGSPKPKHAEIHSSADHGHSVKTPAPVEEAAPVEEEEVVEKASPVKEKVEAAVEKVEEKAPSVVEAVKENASAVVPNTAAATKEAAVNAKDAAHEAVPAAAEHIEKPKSANPQNIDPGHTARRDASNPLTTSGKQEGLSNADTGSAVLHEERGDYISKKGEDIHDTAKLKGTVDINRPLR